ELLVVHSLVGVIVEIDVGDLDVAGRKRIGVHAEAVILRGNFHLFGEEIFHRMIRAVMAKFQFKRLSAKREAAELVAEADAEDGDVSDQLSDVFDSVADGLRIRSEEHTSELQSR